MTPPPPDPASELLSRRVFPRAFVVGLGTGLVAIAFRLTLEAAEHLRTALLRHAEPLGAGGLALVVAATVALVLAAVAAVRRFCPEAAGSGIPLLKTILDAGGKEPHPVRLVVTKFVSGVLAIGSGLCLGREGPTVQMGAAVASAVAGRRAVTPAERRSLLATGAGAGLAAAFNAPLAGVVFLLEELRLGLTGATLTAALVASLTADVLARRAVGELPVFHVRQDLSAPLEALPLFALLGVLCGAGGWAFNAALLTLQRRLRAKSWRLAAAKAAAAGVAVGAVGFWRPEWVGGGIEFVDGVLRTGGGTAGVLAAVLAVRFALTLASYSAGTAGGLFAPVLMLGAVTGLLVGRAGQAVAPEVVPFPAAFAVAGMAGWFAGTVRAPLTGIVLMVEMTADYTLILPLMAVTLPAVLVGDALGTEPVYDALQRLDREAKS